MFEAKDQPLRQDVNALGTLLGEVLQEQGGAGLFAQVEAARLEARRRRLGQAQADAQLSSALGGLAPAQALELVRAFSAYFGLVNLAERVHRIRRRRAYLAADAPRPQPGSLVAVLQQLRQQGVPREALFAALAELEVTPVFTAHPTEATRRTLLTKEQRMARALVDGIAQAQLPGERRGALGRIRQEVTTAWQTDELASQPSVAEEVEHVVFYLTEVIYRIVPVFYEGLADAVQAVYGGAPPPLPRPLVRFGSWVGGDMDGNPNVGPATIRATLTRHRALILKRYGLEVRELFDHLSQSSSRVAPGPTLQARLAAARLALPDEVVPERYAEMPYRSLLWLMARRLEATEADKRQGYAGPEELLADLRGIADSLAVGRGHHAGLFRVERLWRRVQTFGFHLATLDVRQDALAHRQAVAVLLGEPDFVTWPPARRVGRLQAALAEATQPPLGPLDEATAKVILVMQTLAACRRQFGASAIGPLIISMCQGPDDVLAVLYLARRAGFCEAAAGAPATAPPQVPLDVAPLFETVPDLNNAGPCLRAMLDDAAYRAHLRGRDDGQLVMLGYSDSSKESGLMASRWALQEAQVTLVQLAGAQGVRLTLFHGRGGTASRGGSKPRAAILAEPPGCVRGRLRLTEQGEIIHAKYGLRDIALRTMELMGGAVLEATLRPPQAGPEAAWRAAMQTMATASREAFRALVYEDPDFFAYFSAATPIDVIARLRIGSRPAARRAQRGIEDLRAIPWVFAWTQNRQMLPGWYGVGAGLQAAVTAHGLPCLQQMCGAWPFFANLLSDTEMVLAKADLPIGARYAALAGDVGRRLWPHIEAAFKQTERLVCAVQGTERLLQAEPMLQQTITLRNPYVDPMSLMQIDLLRRWRQGDRTDGALERALLTTVKGIARGLQNTG